MNFGEGRHLIRHETDGQSSQRGLAPLAAAAQRGDVHEVRLLLREGKDPDVSQENGMTAMHWGSFHGDIDIMEPLREAGANEYAQDVLGNTPLHYTVWALPPADALEEVERAAAEGLAIAQASLGKMHISGDGAPQDAVVGVSWYLKSAKAGHAQSQYVVGVAYASGEGAPQDSLRAKYWMQEAADQGHDEAQKLVRIRWSDNHDAGRQGAGLAPLAAAAQRGDVHEVRLLLREGKDPDVSQENGMTAMHWGSFHGDIDIMEPLREAGANEYAQDVLGNTPLHYTVWALPPADALEEVERAAAEGLAIAQASLGKMHISGDGAPQDAVVGVSWYLKSAKAGHAQSQYVVGMAYASGEGAPQDDLRAKYWMQEAADQGHEEAQKMVRILSVRAHENETVFLPVNRNVELSGKQTLKVAQTWVDTWEDAKRELERARKGKSGPRPGPREVIATTLRMNKNAVGRTMDRIRSELYQGNRRLTEHEAFVKILKETLKRSGEHTSKR